MAAMRALLLQFSPKAATAPTGSSSSRGRGAGAGSSGQGCQPYKPQPHPAPGSATNDDWMRICAAPACRWQGSGARCWQHGRACARHGAARKRARSAWGSSLRTSLWRCQLSWWRGRREAQAWPGEAAARGCGWCLALAPCHAEPVPHHPKPGRAGRNTAGRNTAHGSAWMAGGGGLAPTVTPRPGRHARHRKRVVDGQAPPLLFRLVAHERGVAGAGAPARLSIDHYFSVVGVALDQGGADLVLNIACLSAIDKCRCGGGWRLQHRRRP